MMMRSMFAALLLALPLVSQTPAVSEGEAMFYKAYWLQKSERRFAESLALYQQFLQVAPGHSLARQAAANRLELLTQLGELEKAREFAREYEGLLGKVAIGRPATERGERGERGDRGAPEGRGGSREARGEEGERGGRARGGRGGRQGRGGNRQEELAAAQKELEEAKEAGNDERVAELTQRIERMQSGGREGANRGRGRGRGDRGDRGGRGGGMRLFMGDTKIADMSEEQLTQLRESLTNMGPMMDRMRERMSEEQAEALDASIKALEKALDGDEMQAAQKALDKLRENMPWRRRGGGGLR